VSLSESESLLGLVRTLEEHNPDFLAMFLARTEDEFLEAVEKSVERTIKLIESGAKNYAVLDEVGLSTMLGLTCSVGDSPIRVSPEGLTCMFNGATVGHNFTICRSGTTFLWSNGEWINLGTLCR
jgi:hypothetical protein